MYMPLHKSQVPDTKRVFYGELRSRPLVDWLNKTKDKDGKSRVLALHRMLFQLVKTAGSAPDAQELHSNWQKLRRRINRLLLKYPVCKQLIHWFTTGFFMTGNMPLNERRVYGPNALLTETGAVLALLELFEAPENWWRVRECHCGKYYFRRFRHQRFCSETCRVQKFRSSEEWKEHRRAKAREYYWLHKAKNTK
jgi:hypothetical protein